MLFSFLNNKDECLVAKIMWNTYKTRKGEQRKIKNEIQIWPPNELLIPLKKKKKYWKEITSFCYIVLFNYYFEGNYEISAFVLQGSGSGSMFVQSLRGDPFRVSSAFYYWYTYTEPSFSKCSILMKWFQISPVLFVSSRKLTFGACFGWFFLSFANFYFGLHEKFLSEISVCHFSCLPG
jgi:hypothetical protein